MVAAPASQTVSMTNLIRSEYSSGKLSVPVEGPLAYVRFQHVRGVPASPDGQGFSVYRLKLLDSMIEGMHSGVGEQQANKELARVMQSLESQPSLTGAVTNAPMTGEATGMLLNLMA